MASMFPITKDRIRNHFHYFWWQYAVLVVVAVFGWNLVFTMTQYRPPEELKVEWYYQGPTTMDTTTKGQAVLEELHAELFPDMEEVTFTLVGTDEMYGDMQIMVWMAAGQGDLYMLQKDSYFTYANGETLLDLQPYVDDGTLNVEGIDLAKAIATDQETGEKGLYGIPMDAVQGLLNYDIAPTGSYACLPLASGNIECALELLSYMLNNWR